MKPCDLYVFPVTLHHFVTEGGFREAETQMQMF